MKVFDKLTNRNFELFASQNYNNPECESVDEFKEDLSRFKYLKRLFRKYDITNDDSFEYFNINLNKLKKFIVKNELYNKYQYLFSSIYYLIIRH